LVGAGTGIKYIEFRYKDATGNVTKILEQGQKYNLEVISSSNKGQIVICEDEYNGSCNRIQGGLINLAQLEESGKYEFTIDDDGSTKSLTSYKTTLPAVIPNGIEIPNTGLLMDEDWAYLFPDADSDEIIKRVPIIKLTKTKGSIPICIINEIKNRLILINPFLPVSDIAALNEIVDFAFHDSLTYADIRAKGISTSHGNYALSPSELGLISGDLIRVLPKTVTVDSDYAKQQGDSPSTIAKGFCNSLADHIVYSSYGVREKGTFRIFESRDARPSIAGEEWRNYKVYWLTHERFQHILEDHGYLNKIPNELKDKDTRFFEYFHPNIIKKINEIITKSTDKDRGFPPGRSDTAFQKDLGFIIGGSKVDMGKDSKIMQIRTDEKAQRTLNRVQTAFPLHPSFGGINK
jgi:hypothetical protein